ncbi:MULTISPECIES: hypothetical protein [unclassified Streptomyces]|uniref:hypothetical protein n=1 Tax=unclassified Streptomyces TaxID=2593676 RepID=UPI000B31AEB1|nr:hypothetical protein [Streptomyces sp. PCS3-D2]WKV74523.1 hypothetical protein AW27_025205 [Streptomyces sp. PCS3-D2]
MAKNKNQKQPAKQQTRSSGQDASRSDSPEQSSQAPSPMDLAHKSKQKKFGHN